MPTKDPEVERTMRGIRRAKGIAPNGKAPILTPLLCQMVAALPDDLSGLRDKAILLIGFAGAFRRSELVGLQVRDIQIGDAGLIVTLRCSKTDQEVRATLTLKIGDIESSTWELYNNLEKNGRLVRVRRLLLDLAAVHSHI